MEPVIKTIQGVEVKFYRNKLLFDNAKCELTLSKIGMDTTVRAKLCDIEIIFNREYTQAEKEEIAQAAIITILQGGKNNG